MGITGRLQQIPLHFIAVIQDKPQLIKTVIPYYEEDDIEDLLPLLENFSVVFEQNDTVVLNLDKSWQLISYILTNSTEMVNLPFLVNAVSDEDNLPAINAILCGTPIGEESEYSTYGYVRYLLPEQVRLISAALSKFSIANIKTRFDRAILTQPNIYTVDWEDAATELEFMQEYFEQLVNYYHDAANKANAMLIYFT